MTRTKSHKTMSYMIREMTTVTAHDSAGGLIGDSGQIVARGLSYDDAVVHKMALQQASPDGVFVIELERK
jgi:hypothetical protein